MKNKDIKELIKTLLSTKTESEMFDLLKGLLTSGELGEISSRLSIVRLLKEGVPQRKIADKLRVGIATVTRGSRELKNGRFKNI
ncbi:MAG: Trp family transcriptional regulator [Candidatus Shapirobacteria bacterium]|jgi:TrpR family trp operon transcriptional repressor